MKTTGAPKAHSQLLRGSTEPRHIQDNLPLWKQLTAEVREVHQRQQQKGKSSARGTSGASSQLFLSVLSRISNYSGSRTHSSHSPCSLHCPTRGRNIQNSDSVKSQTKKKAKANQLLTFIISSSTA